MQARLGRRAALAGATTLAAASLVRSRDARAAKALTVVLESEVIVLDPRVITAVGGRVTQASEAPLS